MRLSIFNEFSPLKLLSIAETRFASVVCMLKRFVEVKSALQQMVISDKWSIYKEARDDSPTPTAQIVKDLILNDVWWDKVDYILRITTPIYEMIRMTDTDTPCLHLVYEMWDSMIEKVKKVIYRFEGKQEDEDSDLYSVIYDILIARWTKGNNPLHCLAHSLNPRYKLPFKFFHLVHMCHSYFFHSLNHKDKLTITDIIAKIGLKKLLAVNHPTRIKRCQK
jgi:hypothetical protein